MHTDYDAIYIAGDPNGRIGNKSDFIECVDDIPKRTAIDIDFKGHGEAILDFCFESKFCFVNGRIDPVNDDFTSISSKCTALVDYFLTSHDHLHSVRSFDVVSMTNVTDNTGINALGNAPNRISDHSMLLMDVCVMVYDAIELHKAKRSDHQGRPDVSTQTDPGGSGDRTVLPPRFQIKNNVPDDFMSNVECRNYILNIIEWIEDSRSTQTEIDQIHKDIVHVYTSEMTKIFGIKKDNPYSNKKNCFTKKNGGTRAWHWCLRRCNKQSTLTYRRKKIKQNFKRQQAEFKLKQDQFDKCVKRKKRASNRERCMQLEEINSSDPNCLWE